MADIPAKSTSPGVYVNEIDAFPSSIVGVPTAVPAFIGYTERAVKDGKPVFLEPVAIGSLTEFESVFGTEFRPVYNIVTASPASGPADFYVGSSGYTLVPLGQAQFLLYWSMRLFFLNGGGNCFVVSVGDYTQQGQAPGGVSVQQSDLLSGLQVLQDQGGPTMLVIPEAILLADIGSFSTVAQAMLSQCALLADRFAILDVFNAQSVTQANVDTALDVVISGFQSAVGSNFLSFGAAYFPLLNTTVAYAGDVDYTNFNPAASTVVSSPASNQSELQILLAQVADSLYTPGSTRRETVQGYIDATTIVVRDPANPDDPATNEKIAALNQNLVNALAPCQQWLNVILAKINVLPPSGAMAGVYTLSDSQSGVWNAPANISVAAVSSCAVKLTDAQQGPMNIPINGKSVNAIRDFAGRGSVVWGARTMDGNSNDWRYIQVRREIIYIEQSIKNALNQFVFAPNVGQTWVTVTSMISNFLQNLWSQGGLMGDKASDAFTVACGLGSTMTAQDILNGFMIVQVTLQMIRPAEFIELTFKQKMQEP